MATAVAVVLIQEHKLQDDASIAEASAWLRGKGGKSLWEPAAPTPGGASGGAGIACWDDQGLGELRQGAVKPWKGRARLARLGAPGWCPIFLGSLCGEVEVVLRVSTVEGLAVVA